MTRIVAAAVLWHGITFTGDRHGHIIKYLVQIGQLKDPKTDKITDDKQGFIDSGGVFQSRPHAREVAIDAGQIKPNHGTLYSEDLW